MPSLNLRVHLNSDLYDGVVVPLRNEGRLSDVVRTMLEVYYTNMDFQFFIDSGGVELAPSTIDDVLDTLNEASDYINGADILLDDLNDDIDSSMEDLAQGTATDESDELNLDDLIEGSGLGEGAGSGAGLGAGLGAGSVSDDRFAQLEDKVSSLTDMVSQLVTTLTQGTAPVAKVVVEDPVVEPVDASVIEAEPIPVANYSEVTFDDEFDDDFAEDEEDDDPTGFGNLLTGAFGTAF